MKLKQGTKELMTSTELMQELFGMPLKLIHNMPEKSRYQEIYNYLIEAEAERLGTQQAQNNTFILFAYQSELYLIPTEIFTATDKDRQQELKVEQIK